MNTTSSTIVQRLWNYCNVLRDDGMSYGDYVEQLTYLLFLKMDHENSTMPGKASTSPGIGTPAGFTWARRLRQALLKAAFEGRLAWI
jgi:type I restriction enzyme M protein